MYSSGTAEIPQPCTVSASVLQGLLNIDSLGGRTKDNTTVVCGKHIKCVISAIVMWMYKRFMYLYTHAELVRVAYECCYNIS